MQRVFTQTFGVVGAILEREGKILLVREAGKNHPDHGKWSHPAGWIDVGEDPMQAVKREVLEESGFVFIPHFVLGIYSLVRNDLVQEFGSAPHAIKITFIGDILKTQQGNLHDDVSEIKWFSPDAIYEMDRATLRDFDIKQMVRDYFAGKRFSLNLLTHTEVVL